MQALPVTSPSAPAPRREEGPDPQDGRFGAVMASYLPFQAPHAPEAPVAREATKAPAAAEVSARSTASRPADKGQSPEKAAPAAPEPTHGTEAQGSDRPTAAAPTQASDPAAEGTQPTPRPSPSTETATATAPPSLPIPAQAPAAPEPTPSLSEPKIALEATSPREATPPAPLAPAAGTPNPVLPSQIALPEGLAADPVKVQITSAEPPPMEATALPVPQAAAATPALPQPPATLLAAPIEPAPKAAVPKSTATPNLAAPVPTAGIGSASPGAEAAAAGTGGESQAKPDSGGPRLQPSPEPAMNPEAPAAAGTEKPFAPVALAPKVDSPRPEPPKAEAPRPTQLPGSGRDAALPLPALAPTASVSAEVKVAPSPVVNQVEGTLRWMVKGAVPEARLQLHPESLGKVSIELKIADGQVHAKVWVQDPAAMQALQDGRASLEQALKQSGLQLGSFDLQQGGDASRQSAESNPPPARSPKEDPSLRSARQEAPAVGGPRTANLRRIELYA